MQKDLGKAGCGGMATGPELGGNCGDTAVLRVGMLQLDWELHIPRWFQLYPRVDEPLTRLLLVVGTGLSLARGDGLHFLWSTGDKAQPHLKSSVPGEISPTAPGLWFKQFRDVVTKVVMTPTCPGAFFCPNTDLEPCKC